MRLMLLSNNRLFSEVLQKALEVDSTLSIQTPELSQVFEQIPEVQPHIIVMDESLPAEQIDHVLRIAYNLEACKVLLVNPNQNDLLTLTSQRSRMYSAGDLLTAILSDASHA